MLQLLLTEMFNPDPEAPLYVAGLYRDLNTTGRSGWLQRGIPAARAETIAQHIFQVGTAGAWYSLCREDEVDSVKLFEMIELHDLGEALFRDVTPADDISKEEKYKMEEKALREIIGRAKLPERLLDVWRTYEAGLTREAQVAWSLDKIDASVRAVHYRNNFDSIIDYLVTHPNAMTMTMSCYPDSERGAGFFLKGDVLFEAMRARLAEFHPYNRARLSDEFFLDVLDGVECITSPDVFPKYHDLLAHSDAHKRLAQEGMASPGVDPYKRIAQRALFFQRAYKGLHQE